MSQTTMAAGLQDPPIPQRANAVGEMSTDDARRATLTFLLFAICLVVGSFMLWRADHTIWAGILTVLAAVCVFSAFSEKSLVAPCPFCNIPINGVLRKPKKPQIKRCPDCYEYSVISGGKIRPMDPNTSGETPRFLSPVFEDAVWPPACVACGAPPTRYESLQGVSYNAALVALGNPFSRTRATLANVPYCDVHRNSVRLIITQSRRMDLKWCSLRMYRQYVALNRSKKSLGTRVHLID